MDLTLDASDSNKRPVDCLPESPQTPLSKKPKIDDDRNIDVTTEGSEHPVEDEKTKPKTRRIGLFYHLGTADVNFIFDVDGYEEVVPVHKCILAFHSPVFRQMLYGELKEKGDIKLTDTSFDAFIDLVKCMYDFQLTIDGSQSKIEPLLELAHKCDVNWVEKECQRILDEIISKNISAILWVLPLAKLYTNDDLEWKCIDTIHAHGNFIIESAEFINCEKELMKEILDISFVDRNETKVFENSINWAKRSCEKAELDPESPKNIRAQLGNCFDLIRFESMTQEQFLQCLSISPAVFSSHEIAQIASKLTRPIPKNRHRESNNDVPLKTFKIESPFITTESSLQQLLEDHTTADVNFVFKNNTNEETEYIPANKCILATYSEIFEDQIKEKPKSNDEIVIAGVSSEVFTYFLQLMYVCRGDQMLAILKEIDDQHIDALLTLNGKYLKKFLPAYNFFYIEHLINTLNEQNVIGRLQLSREHSFDVLKTECIDLIKKKGEQMINSEAFMECSQENLKTILELGVWNNEKFLIDACIKWAEKYCQKNQLDTATSYDLRTALGDALELIPFSKMDAVEFINFQHGHKGLFTADETIKIFDGFANR